jgi:hypothetical protein
MNLKYFLTIFSFVFLFTYINAEAKVYPQLPAQIENYTLDTTSVRYDSHCDPYMGDTLCQGYWWGYYIGPNNKQVGFYLNDVSDGMSVYKQKLTSGNKMKVSSNTVYQTGGEVAWTLKNTAVNGGFAFNSVKTLEVETKATSQGTNVIENKNAKGNNPVTKYFIAQYPSDGVIKKEVTKKASTKKMELTITSPKIKEKLIAGEEYEIKWKSKNIPSNSKILFQLMYGGGETSFGTAVDNTGSYVWKVPVQYAQSDTKIAPYKLVGYVTGFDGKDQLSDYTDWFSIVPASSKEIYPIMINTHTEDEIWKWGTSQTIQWRELNSVDLYTVTLVSETTGKEKIIKKVKSNKEPFVQQTKWKIDKKTKPGTYYWKIEGFNKKKLVAESKSDIFEIIE